MRLYASYIPDLLNMNPKQIILESDYRLTKLFDRSFPKVDFRQTKNRQYGNWIEETIDVDFQISVGSLPKFFRQNINDFPTRKSLIPDMDKDIENVKNGESSVFKTKAFHETNRGYLKPCNHKVEKFRKKYQKISGNRYCVGISWRGGSVRKENATWKDKNKSTSLTDWIPVFTVPNCFFITLQHGNIEDEVEDFTGNYNFDIYQDKEVDPMSDFDDFAAQIASLNLVISISNTTAHLSGALGINTMTLLTKVPNWFWMYDGEDALWYENMKLLRQNVRGDWETIFSDAQSLLKLLSTKDINTV